MPPKKGTRKGASATLPLSPSSGKPPGDRKTGSYPITDADHGRVTLTRLQYGLTTELMQAIFEIIMRKYYIINRDIVLRQHTDPENDDFQSVGSENSLVPTEADKKVIHARMYEGIAGAESREGPGNTYIPLDMVLGLRQPANGTAQERLLVLLMGPYALDADTRRAFFERKLNSPTYSYLGSQYVRFVASPSAGGESPASRVGLDLTYFGSGNRMAGLTLVEEPTGVFRARVDSIDAHVSIEPGYRKTGIEFFGGKPRVTGWHFSNHHKSVGTRERPSYEDHYTFYTNYGHTMTHEQAEQESIRSAAVAAVAPTATPGGGGGGGRFGVLASPSGASAESPPGSPYRLPSRALVPTATEEAAALVPAVAANSSLLLNNPFGEKIAIIIKPNGDIKFRESSGKKARMSKSAKVQVEKDFIGSEYFQLLAKQLANSLAGMNDSTYGVSDAKEKLKAAIRIYETNKYVAEQLPITFKYITDLQKELFASDGLKSKKATIINPSIKAAAEADVRSSASSIIEPLLMTEYAELFAPRVQIPPLSRRLNFSDSPRKLIHPLSPSGSGIAGQRRTRNNLNAENAPSAASVLARVGLGTGANEGSAAGAGGQIGYNNGSLGGGGRRRRTRRH